MGYIIELNSVLKLPKETGISKLKVGETFRLVKKGEHLYSLHKPIEFCDADYQFVGKLQIDMLTLKTEQTILEGKILLIFSPEDAKVYSQKYIKQ